MTRQMITGTFLCVLLMTGCSKGGVEVDDATILSLENAALDRWDKGDVYGFLELYSADITYFDPSTEKRRDGIDAMRKELEPIQGKIHVERREMLNPSVQRHGNVAVLTFNLIDWKRSETGDLKMVRWNATEVYARINGRWRLIHEHWSHPNADSSD